ncbi:MAG: flagellar hook-length control protein FliK [Clostridiales bacterium]|nr:flagellar hook-length control protein FliK [Clostridiales bacterium]
MVMVPTHHVISGGNSPSKTASIDTDVRDPTCSFTDLLKNKLWIHSKRTENDGDSDEADVAGRDGPSVWEGCAEEIMSFMLCPIMDIAENSTKAQNSIPTPIPGMQSHIPAGHALHKSARPSLYTAGVLDVQNKLKQPSTAEDAFSEIVIPSSADDKADETVKPTIPKVPVPGEAEQLSPDNRLAFMNESAVDTAKGLPAAVPGSQENNANQKSVNLRLMDGISPETDILPETTLIFRKDTGLEQDGNVSGQARRDSPQKELPVIGRNEFTEGPFELSESQPPTDLNEQPPIHGYIMFGSSNQRDEELTSLSGAASRYDKQEIILQLAEKISMLTRGEHSEMQVLIKPEELGRIVVKVVLKDGEMTVKITTQSQLVKDLLESNQHSLKSLLAQEGYVLARLDVNIGSMYQQPRWTDFRDAEWLNEHTKKEQRIDAMGRISDRHEESIVYLSEGQNRIDCFA